MRILIPLLVLLLVPMARVGKAQAANPNDLDTTCAGTGTVDDALGFNDFSLATLIQPDGKILAVGHSDGVGLSDDMIVIRYLPNCTRDSSFGSGGLVNIDASGADNTDEARAAVLQPDGKIVLAGRRSNGTDDDLVVVRLTSGGALDPTWDGDGISVFDRGNNEIANGIVRQADGKIAVAGQTAPSGSLSNSLLVRFNTNGSLDDSFNGSGSRTYAISPNQDTFTGLVAQSDGKLVASGRAFNGVTGDDGIAVRVNSNGTPDTSFATSGTFTDNVGDARFHAVAIRPDGRILLAGYKSNGSDNDFYLRQLTTTGATQGFNTVNFSNGNDQANAIALQQDDGVVLAGSSSVSGASIAVFGTGLGTSYTSSTGSPCGADQLQGVAVAADGTIVATGSCDPTGLPDFLMARWDGSPVMGFATVGTSVNENVGTFAVTVTRKGTLNAVSINYVTVSGTAESGVDYTGTSGILNFAAGVASQTFPIQITNDTAKEVAESFGVMLSGPTPLPWSVTLAPPTTTTVTIYPSDQRVDGLVKNNGGANAGSNIYNTTGASQTVTQNANRGQKKVYYVTVQNDGNVTNGFRVKGTASSTGYTVAYFASTTATNITTAVTRGTYSTGSLLVGATKLIRVEITSLSTAPHGSTKSVAVTSTWTGDATSTDVVKANLHTL